MTRQEIEKAVEYWKYHTSKDATISIEMRENLYSLLDLAQLYLDKKLVEPMSRPEIMQLILLSAQEEYSGEGKPRLIIHEKMFQSLGDALTSHIAKKEEAKPMTREELSLIIDGIDAEFYSVDRNTEAMFMSGEISIYDLADILKDIIPHYKFFSKEEQLSEASQLKTALSLPKSEPLSIELPKNPYPKQEEGMNNPLYYAYQRAIDDCQKAIGEGL